MSDPIDNEAFDHYSSRQSPLSRRYRELGEDEVPPELDRVVLDKARAAVANPSSGGGSRWRRWSAPLALAASVVLAVAIVVDMDVDRGFEATSARKVSAPQAPATPSSPEEEVALESSVPAATVADEEAQPLQASEPSSGVVADSGLVRQGQPEDRRVEARKEASVVESVRFQRSVARMAAESPRPSAPPPPAVVVPAESAARAKPSRAREASGYELEEAVVTAQKRASAPVEPERWLERIRELRKEGKTTAADEEWRRFSETYPEYPVSSEDVARSPQ